jgi:hypothetical protein
VKQGNTQVREFCRKYLQHNKSSSWEKNTVHHV